MASPTVNVVRYTALLSGIVYGLVHQGTLQRKYDDDKVTAKIHNREHLIEEAKKAYAQKLVADKAGGAAQLITDIEDPKFDLEKVVESWTKSS